MTEINRIVRIKTGICIRKHIALFIGVFIIMAGGKLGAQEICGVLTDSLSGDPIQLASVFLENNKSGAISGKDGSFCLDTTGSTNPYTLNISHISYKPVSVQVETLDSSLVILLSRSTSELDQVTVTASRHRQTVREIPSRLNTLASRDVRLTTANNSDDLLLRIPNIYINRNQGIYSRSAGVTMRGLSGTARTLVMINGVPLNKSKGGSITWNLLTPEEIERVEVLKGPASAIYGNNAMAGAINIITKNPADNHNLSAGVFGGTYGTYGARLKAGLKKMAGKTALSLGLGGGFRKSEGYYLVKEEDRDSIDVRTFLDEYNVNAYLGLQRANHGVNIEYHYYDGDIGEGIEVYEDDGSHDRKQAHYTMLDYSGEAGAWKLSAKAFYNHEKETRTSENINSSGKYKHSDTYGQYDDYGLWSTASRKAGKVQDLTMGIDVKSGRQNDELIYRTATDHLQYGGNILSLGLFIQDEIKLSDGRWIITAGLRFDYAAFYDGFLTITDPSSETGFLDDLDEKYEDSKWQEFSPKLGLRYRMNKDLSVYLSYSKGFMPPRLDDLTRSGRISKGFKKANPELKPETIQTFELGLDFAGNTGFEIYPAVYYSLGEDFQYFVKTGASVDIGKKPQPVLQRQNISGTEIFGAEIEVKYSFRPMRYIYANYAYNHAIISEYDASPEFNEDLTGKELIEVPDHLAAVGVYYTSRIVDFSVSVNYTGEQWFDDENTQKIDAFTKVNLKLVKQFLKNFTAELSVDNLFDVRYIDNKGYQAPGRFIIGELRYAL